ncbi:hypothetical protein RFI_06528 [Reticulomyxa filosa]|uniref:Uncharacterized protein n=1 Tax=Reticulomyxa filosa TaxID=46433 RepID=X6NZ85_RETFI|nr:hypothetical protein RFI_06528 [Reticulomyxa filosa]|eukprot:ETO30592.1 hypothetical protein RFI_06528 [Reticulomyxa filosa]
MPLLILEPNDVVIVVIVVVVVPMPALAIAMGECKDCPLSPFDMPTPCKCLGKCDMSSQFTTQIPFTAMLTSSIIIPFLLPGFSITIDDMSLSKLFDPFFLIQYTHVIHHRNIIYTYTYVHSSAFFNCKVACTRREREVCWLLVDVDIRFFLFKKKGGEELTCETVKVIFLLSNLFSFLDAKCDTKTDFFLLNKLIREITFLFFYYVSPSCIKRTFAQHSHYGKVNSIFAWTDFIQWERKKKSEMTIASFFFFFVAVTNITYICLSSPEAGPKAVGMEIVDMKVVVVVVEKKIKHMQHLETKTKLLGIAKHCLSFAFPVRAIHSIFERFLKGPKSKILYTYIYTCILQRVEEYVFFSVFAKKENKPVEIVNGNMAKGLILNNISKFTIFETELIKYHMHNGKTQPK